MPRTATTDRKRFRPVAALSILTGVLLLALAAWLAWPNTAPEIPEDDNHVAVAEDGTKQAPTPTRTFAGTACPDTTRTPAPAAGDPGTWTIPALGITAPWHTDTHGTQPVLPDAPAGIRYEPSRPLGAATGPTIMAGHVDYAPGALSAAGGELSPWGHLHDAKDCQQITVTDEDGHPHRYVITGLDTASQNDLKAPADGTPEDQLTEWQRKLYRSGNDAHVLYLITCSGPSVGDAGGAFQFRYADNLIVTAHPID